MYNTLFMLSPKEKICWQVGVVESVARASSHDRPALSVRAYIHICVFLPTARAVNKQPAGVCTEC